MTAREHGRESWHHAPRQRIGERGERLHGGEEDEGLAVGKRERERAQQRRQRACVGLAVDIAVGVGLGVGLCLAFCLIVGAAAERRCCRCVGARGEPACGLNGWAPSDWL